MKFSTKVTLAIGAALITQVFLHNAGGFGLSISAETFAFLPPAVLVVGLAGPSLVGLVRRRASRTTASVASTTRDAEVDEYPPKW